MACQQWHSAQATDASGVQVSESHRERLRAAESESLQALATIQKAADERHASLKAELVSTENALQAQVTQSVVFHIIFHIISNGP